MTLIEVMVVVALMGLMMGTMVFGTGLFGGARKRAAAALILAGARKATAHANSTGKPTRLSIDLESGKVQIEESSSSGALRQQVTQDGEDVRYGPSTQELVDEVQSEIDDVVGGGFDQRPSFTAVDIWVDSDGSPGRTIEKDVKFRLVQTEHDEEPITEGKAFIYFWPGGETERSVVQLGRGLDDDGLTVVISALTGRAKIERGRVELPQSRFGDEDFQEREAL
ncbi:MAG: prepilin-type N-terminal cleavage/methylation domain-containing protein [Polyangiaceae bacterium]|nr:prepilin-type N-terminal cleavage/methylation domain-containing protein [Polyangiaceae bacterium]